MTHLIKRNFYKDIDKIYLPADVYATVLIEGICAYDSDDIYDLDLSKKLIRKNGNIINVELIKKQTQTYSATNAYDKIMEYAKREWVDDQRMIEYEHDKQVSSYEYYNNLGASKIKEYAYKEWTDGHGYTDWSMVEYEYKRQKSSYDYIMTVNCPQSIISEWTEGGYTDWSMVEYDYRN